MRISKSFLGRALALESSLTRNPNVLEMSWTVFLHKYNSTSLLHVHHLQPGYLHELPCQCSTAPGNIFSIKQPCFIYISFTFHLQFIYSVASDAGSFTSPQCVESSRALQLSNGKGPSKAARQPLLSWPEPQRRRNETTETNMWIKLVWTRVISFCSGDAGQEPVEVGAWNQWKLSSYSASAQ